MGSGIWEEGVGEAMMEDGGMGGVEGNELRDCVRKRKGKSEG